jgi:hypothetical protein
MNEKSFSLEQMKAALCKTDISENEKAMLVGHSAVKSASTAAIAEFAGYKPSAGNLMYGKLCRRIAERLDFISPGDNIYTIAEIDPRRDAAGRIQWRMDAVVQQALDGLGWMKHSKG